MNNPATIAAQLQIPRPLKSHGSALSDAERAQFQEAANSLRAAQAALASGVAPSRDAAARAIAILSAMSRAHSHEAPVWGMLGNAYALAADWDNAVNAFARALSLIPNEAVAHFALGSALAKKGELCEAIAAFRGARRLEYPPARCNLGVALLLTGEFEEAARELHAAIDIDPHDAVAHWNIALLNLLQGNWAAGWSEYEWRWRWNEFPSPRRSFTQAHWRGEDFAGRTLFLHAEQGFGDTIQFIRYIPLAAQRGGEMVVEIQPELLPLLRQVPGVRQWIAAGEAPGDLDLHCPMGSLPGLFGTTPQTIPAQIPSLRPREEAIDRWRKTMGASDGRPRVGIAWAGNSTFNLDRTRSLPLEQWDDILSLDSVRFFSLQKGKAVDRIAALGLGRRVTDLGSEFHDFEDTAAAISLCDLVLTTDTSIAHLAGAMGRPVWVMLQFVPDWRWMLNRSDSPWYPSASLFRQTSAGDWPGVTAAVARALAQL